MNIKNHGNEFSDTDSEDNLIETFLDIKSRKTVNDAIKNNENFEYTKVVEVFITRDLKVFAHCSICLYKTEIKSINSLLEHFMDIHASHCKDGQNAEYLVRTCNNCCEEGSFEISDKHENTESCIIDINFKNFEYKSDSNQQSEPNEITEIDPQSINVKNECEMAKFIPVNWKSECFHEKIDVSDTERMAEMDKLTIANWSLIDNFENNFMYPSDSSQDFSTTEEIEYCDKVLEEDFGIVQEKCVPLVCITDENYKVPLRVDAFNSNNIQKLDEKFYQQLSGLDPDQSLCQFCNTKFRHISRHYKNQHPEIILCEIGKCFQAFNSLPELNIHHERFHNDPKHAFSCTLCQYKTNGLHSFRFHYQRIHLNIKDFCCDFCDMKFFSNYEKTKHMRSHTGQKPYICETCNSKYPTKQQLNLHIQKYHSEPLFECNICCKKFHRKQTLKEHQMTKHAQNEKKIICEICGDRFFLRKHWREHFNNVHNPSRKRWTCNECGKSFSRNSNLRDHKTIHCLNE